MQPQVPYQQQPGQPGYPQQVAGQGGYPGQQYPAGHYPAHHYAGEPAPGAPGPGDFQPGYQQPGWYQNEPPKRRAGLIVGISAAVVVVAVIALILVLTLGGNSKNTANTTTPTTGGLPGPLTSGTPVTSAPPATSAAVPAGNVLTSRATAERAALLISDGQANVAGVYVCTAERQQFIAENTATAGVSVAITVTTVTENGSTAQAAVHVKAQNAATGQAQEGDSAVTLARNTAGAWYVCTGQLGAQDQGVPNEANAPAPVAVPSGGPVAPTTDADNGGTPGADQATQVAQSWAAAINAGDVAGAQQYLCSSYQGTPGGTSTGVTLTLQGISQTGQDTATAEFLVDANGQQATAQVAMKVENSRWTICQGG
jgi:hypothetical protein